jgi:hypothetical protein
MGEMQHLIKKPRANAQNQWKGGVELLVHRNVKAAIERHVARIHQIHADGAVCSNYRTAKRLLIQWRFKSTGAPSPAMQRHLSPEPTSPQPGTATVPPCDHQGGEQSHIQNLQPGYVHSHTPYPTAESFSFYPYAYDSRYDTDMYTDMLTDEGTFTG